MADIVLLDANGTSATYQNVDSITVPRSGGGTATFTTGGGGGTKPAYLLNDGDTVTTLYFNVDYNVAAILPYLNYDQTETITGAGLSYCYLGIGHLSAFDLTNLGLSGEYAVAWADETTGTVVPIYATTAVPAFGVTEAGWQVASYTPSAAITVDYADINPSFFTVMDEIVAQDDIAFGEHGGGGGTPTTANVTLDFLDRTTGIDYFPATQAELDALLISANVGKVALYNDKRYEIVKKSVSVYRSKAVEVSSGTMKSISITCHVGDLVIVAFATRSAITSTTSGWTVLPTSQSTSDIVPACVSNQCLTMAYKTATSTTETFSVTQASSGRIYINGVSLQNVSFKENNAFQYQSVVGATQGNVKIVATRPSADVVVWGVTRSLWDSTAPYDSWTASNNSTLIQLSTSSQARLLLAVDSSSDATVTFAELDTTSRNDAIIAQPISLACDVGLSELPDVIKNSQILNAPSGTVWDEINIAKPVTLLAGNVVNGVDVAGVIGAAGKMSSGYLNIYNGYAQSQRKLSSIPSVIIGTVNPNVFTTLPQTCPVSLIYCEYAKVFGYTVSRTDGLFLMRDSLSSATVEITSDGYLKITSPAFVSNMSGKDLFVYYIE